MFICTGNSCRSQMAEGFARRFGSGLIEAHSAGLIPAGVNKNAVKVMAELGIDISEQDSKAIDFKLVDSMDMVVTLCSHAELMCPRTPTNVLRVHWPIEDPIGATGSEEKVLNEFRRARDEIRGRIIGLINEIKAQGRQEVPQAGER